MTMMKTLVRTVEERSVTNITNLWEGRKIILPFFIVQFEFRLATHFVLHCQSKFMYYLQLKK